MLPPEPDTSAAVDPARGWWWRFETAAGAEVTSTQFSDERFLSQADAESWVGEIWADLAGEGIDAVTLFDNDRAVYGPMSLHA
jgi:hypothetical protein